MTRRDLVLDAAVAVLVLGLTLAMLEARGLGMPDPGTRGADGLSTLIAAATALPLVVRRLAPFSVYAATSLATLALLALGYGVDIPFGPLFAVYTLAVATTGEGRPVRRVLALGAVVAFVPVALVAIAATGMDIAGLVAPGLLVWGLFFAGAWIAGDRTRLRRERVAELEERAHRAAVEAEQERRVAAAEERLRIARELHDSAGHAINVILVQAGAARLLHERDPDGSRRAIGTIEDVARNTIGEIDRLVRVLRDGESGADPAPVGPTMIDELIEHHRSGGLRVDADLDRPHRQPPPTVARATYRILQEALTNVARHGQGGADVTVRYGDSVVDISVTNPVGPGGSATSGGHGITGMRERASLVGGTLEAGRAGGTFRLHARLPYAEVMVP